MAAFRARDMNRILREVLDGYICARAVVTDCGSFIVLVGIEIDKFSPQASVCRVTETFFDIEDLVSFAVAQWSFGPLFNGPALLALVHADDPVFSIVNFLLKCSV